jgi:pimeloyl-ACP methyl ester carboxylesterase
MSEWREGSLAVNGVDIHYYRSEEEGRPPMVLAHGFSDSGLCWERVARRLEDSFDIIMPDARNHGMSGRAVAGEGDLAKDLAGLIEGLSLDRPVLIGHSMGAATVAELAGRFPGLPSRIVLEDPPWMAVAGDEEVAEAEARREGFREYIKTMSRMSEKEIIESGKQLSPSWHDDEFPAWAASKKQVCDEAMAGVGLRDWRAVASAIRCPALLVHADTSLGGIVGEDVASEACRLNQDISAQHVAGAGHNIRRERFDEFVSAIQAFLYED